jgi:Holliday junction resolvase RusA-like endonuclease
MTDTMWRVSIPGVPPSTNHMYEAREVRHATGSYMGRRKAPGVEEYQSIAATFVRLAIPAWFKKELANRPNDYIRLRYWFYLSRDIDCDNALKALNDAIAHAMGVDDKRFLPNVIDKFVVHKQEPRTEVEVEFHERTP